MGKILKAMDVLGIIILLTFLLNSSGVQAVSGSTNGPFTAYAMGNLYNYYGESINVGDFANHYYVYCGSVDPAANWPDGTKINTPLIYIPDRYDENPYGRSVFYLNDVGDFDCLLGSYWVDIYFGRYKLSSQNCLCDNVWGSCIDGQTNSCTNATNFGYKTYTYTYSY